MNYQIQTLNAISPAIYTQLGEHYHVSDHAEQRDAILVRSASMARPPACAFRAVHCARRRRHEQHSD